MNVWYWIDINKNNTFFKYILIYFLIKYLFLISKKCVSAHQSLLITPLFPY